MRLIYRFIARYHNKRCTKHTCKASAHTQAAIDHREAEQRWRMRGEFG